MAETWGNGHYSCYGCSEQSNKDSARCRGCFTYTPLMQPYYKNWTQEKKQTNVDRIRAMSDEELAEFLMDNTNCDCCNIQCPDKLNCPSMSSCFCRWQEWLQSEVEG